MTEKIWYTIERCVRGRPLAGTIKYAPVAQLDRALDSDGERKNCKNPYISTLFDIFKIKLLAKGSVLIANYPFLPLQITFIL